MSRAARSLTCASVLLAALFATSACESDPRCPGSPHACPAESARWPIRTTAPPGYRVENDVVTDPTTGLMWQRRVPREMYRWDRASEYCEDLELGDASDWRLPSRMELVSLLDYERLDFARGGSTLPEPSLDRAAFPDTPPAEFWTTSYFGDPLEVWTVSFGSARLFARPRELLLPRVRCVRTEREVRAASAGETRFSVDTETATERATGLVWQRKRGPESTNAEAATYCSGLTLDGRGGFRLPHVKELISLASATSAGKAIDPDIFEAPKYSYDSDVWTSTPAGPSERQGVTYASFFLVAFTEGGRVVNDGSFDSKKGTLVAPVRCVRGTSASTAPRPDAGPQP